MAKRLHTPKAKPGELRACWGKVDRHSGPDVCYAWGAGIQSPDARLLHSTLSAKRLTFDFPSTNTKYDLSFIEELEARGYDITTLRFSVRKKCQS
jgi:hypothetical protein